MTEEAHTGPSARDLTPMPTNRQTFNPYTNQYENPRNTTMPVAEEWRKRNSGNKESPPVSPFSRPITLHDNVQMESIDLGDRHPHAPTAATRAARTKSPLGLGDDALDDLDHIVEDDVPAHVPMNRPQVPHYDTNEKSGEPWLPDGDNAKVSKKRDSRLQLLVAIIILCVIFAISTVVLGSMVGMGKCAAGSHKPVNASTHAAAAMDIHTTTMTVPMPTFVTVTETTTLFTCTATGAPAPTKPAQLLARTTGGWW